MAFVAEKSYVYFRLKSLFCKTYSISIIPRRDPPTIFRGPLVGHDKPAVKGYTWIITKVLQKKSEILKKFTTKKRDVAWHTDIKNLAQMYFST